MNNENGTDETLEVQDEVVSTEATESVESTEEEFDWKAEAEKQKEIAENQKIRAEKAEEKAKKTEGRVETRKDDLSTMDVIALSKSNVDTEDMDSVLQWAKFNKISVREALQSDELTAVLAVRKEKRNTAMASNTGTSRRSSGKVSDETLMANASKGNIPDNDDDIARLIKAKQVRKN
jgi:hypothetical protein